MRPDGQFIPLGQIRQPRGKLVTAWAFEGDCDPTTIKSNLFSMEWPKRSGRMLEYPEIDGRDWFTFAVARRKIHKGQVGFLERLAQHLGIPMPSEAALGQDPMRKRLPANGNLQNCCRFLDLPSNAAVCRVMPRGLQSLTGPGPRHRGPLQGRRMGEPLPGIPPSGGPPEDRLDSWKEIAAYLDRDVTTVQRWEKREGMPVHRHQHARMGSVYASRSELDLWARGRNLRGPETGNHAPLSDPPESPPDRMPPGVPVRWRLALPLAVVTAALAIYTTLRSQRAEHFWRSPIAGARVQVLTDFDGVTQAAAVSRDGHFVAFLSDRDGQMDVWLTQVGSESSTT